MEQETGKGAFEAVIDIGQKHDKLLQDALDALEKLVMELTLQIEDGLKDLGCEVSIRTKGREVGYETEITIFRGEAKELDLLAWYSISPWSKLSTTQHLEKILNLVIEKFSKRIADFKE